MIMNNKSPQEYHNSHYIDNIGDYMNLEYYNSYVHDGMDTYKRDEFQYNDFISERNIDDYESYMGNQPYY